MREPKPFPTLVRYFFSRFFENDLVESSGDTLTTVLRALSIVAVPGLMFAFWLQPLYPQRQAWGRIGDHYFFVLYSFLVLAGVAIFEWDMLFPDRLDFLVLGPLPLQGRTMLGAKEAALAGFLALFLAAANVFGVGMLAAVTHEPFWRQVWAQTLAVVGAGIFGALSVMAAGGLLISILPARAFRVISPVLRMAVVAILGLLLVHYGRFGGALAWTLAGDVGRARWVPTFWFLGVYERALRGAAAAPFAAAMQQRAWWGLTLACGAVVATYPLAWLRMQRMALESAGGARRRRAGRLDAWVAQRMSNAGQRAVLPLIGKTLARNNRYQVYLALYCGTGVALAIACVCTLAHGPGGMRLVVSHRGMHAVAPLLMFWTVAGLRMAFALPVNLPARWVFRVTGVEREGCIAAARVWTLACSLSLLAGLIPLLALLGMSWRGLLVQAVCGALEAALMVEALLFADRGIPFAQPRSPGKTSLPLMLTLYVAVLPAFVMEMVELQIWLEHKPWWLFAAVAALPLVYRLGETLRRAAHIRPEDGDEIEAEYQLLGLGAE